MTGADRPQPGTDPKEPAIELWETVAPMLADNLYLVLGTVDAAGNPWVSPVFFAARDESLLYWVSSPASRHSRNIAVRPRIAITVFDSRAAIGAAEAVYMTATAAATATGTATAAGAVGLKALNARLPAGRQMSSADLVPGGPLALYEAAVDDHYVLVRGGDPRFGNDVDTSYRVTPTSGRPTA